jgi:lactam utilization protein B
VIYSEDDMKRAVETARRMILQVGISHAYLEPENFYRRVVEFAQREEKEKRK